MEQKLKMNDSKNQTETFSVSEQSSSQIESDGYALRDREDYRKNSDVILDDFMHRAVQPVESEIPMNFKATKSINTGQGADPGEMIPNNPLSNSTVIKERYLRDEHDNSEDLAHYQNIPESVARAIEDNTMSSKKVIQYREHPHVDLKSTDRNSALVKQLSKSFEDARVESQEFMSKSCSDLSELNSVRQPQDKYRRPRSDGTSNTNYTDGTINLGDTVQRSANNDVPPASHRIDRNMSSLIDATTISDSSNCCDTRNSTSQDSGDKVSESNGFLQLSENNHRADTSPKTQGKIIPNYSSKNPLESNGLSQLSENNHRADTSPKTQGKIIPNYSSKNSLGNNGFLQLSGNNHRADTSPKTQRGIIHNYLGDDILKNNESSQWPNNSQEAAVQPRTSKEIEKISKTYEVSVGENSHDELIRPNHDKGHSTKDSLTSHGSYSRPQVSEAPSSTYAFETPIKQIDLAGTAQPGVKIDQLARDMPNHRDDRSEVTQSELTFISDPFGDLPDEFNDSLSFVKTVGTNANVNSSRLKYSSRNDRNSPTAPDRIIDSKRRYAENLMPVDSKQRNPTSIIPEPKREFLKSCEPDTTIPTLSDVISCRNNVTHLKESISHEDPNFYEKAVERKNNAASTSIKGQNPSYILNEVTVHGRTVSETTYDSKNPTTSDKIHVLNSGDNELLESILEKYTRKPVHTLSEICNDQADPKKSQFTSTFHDSSSIMNDLTRQPYHLETSDSEDLSNTLNNAEISGLSSEGSSQTDQLLDLANHIENIDLNIKKLLSESYKENSYKFHIAEIYKLLMNNEFDEAKQYIRTINGNKEVQVIDNEYNKERSRIKRIIIQKKLGAISDGLKICAQKMCLLRSISDEMRSDIEALICEFKKSSRGIREYLQKIFRYVVRCIKSSDGFDLYCQLLSKRGISLPNHDEENLLRGLIPPTQALANPKRINLNMRHSADRVLRKTQIVQIDPYNSMDDRLLAQREDFSQKILETGPENIIIERGILQINLKNSEEGATGQKSGEFMAHNSVHENPLTIQKCDKQGRFSTHSGAGDQKNHYPTTQDPKESVCQNIHSGSKDIHGPEKTNRLTDIHLEDEWTWLKNELPKTISRILLGIAYLHQQNKRLQNDVNTSHVRDVEVLQQENITLQNSLSKVQEKFFRLKKINVDLSNAVTEKNTVIKKAKKLIKKHQRVIRGFTAVSTQKITIEDLQSKVEALRVEINQEKDKQQRDRLIQQLLDYEKRISDFLSI